MESEFSKLNRLTEIMDLYGRDLIAGLLILIIGLLLVKYLIRWLRIGLGRVTRNAAVAATISTVVNITLLAVVIMAAAVEAGVEVQPVFRLVMVIFLCAIGLIIFFRPYIPTLPFKVGQTVKAGGLLGKIEATTVLNTRLKTFDGKTVFVPNKNILNDIVINYHFTPNRRFKLDIPIRYDQDLMKAKQVLEAVMTEDPRVLAKPGPVVYVLDLTNGCILLGGRGWVDNKKYWVTKCDLLEKLKLRFDHEGVVISYPHMGVHHIEESGRNEAPELSRTARAVAPVSYDDDEM